MNLRTPKSLAADERPDPRPAADGSSSKRRHRPNLAGYLAEDRIISLKSRSKDRAFEELADTLDPQEAAMMRAIAGQFEQALRRGDAAHAADSVDAMRKRSGAVKKRGDEFKL